MDRDEPQRRGNPNGHNSKGRRFRQFPAAARDIQCKETLDPSGGDDIPIREIVSKRSILPIRALREPAPSSPEGRHGSTRVALLISRVPPNRRAVSLVGTLADITEGKQREERSAVSCASHHRARNMLVDAMARQTAASSPEDCVGCFSEYIWALADHQDLLVRSERNGGEIGDLAHAQLSHFADLIGCRIAVQGPKPASEPAFSASHWARPPRARRQEIRRALRGYRRC
jgi:hypothetical protein